MGNYCTCVKDTTAYPPAAGDPSAKYLAPVRSERERERATGTPSNDTDGLYDDESASLPVVMQAATSSVGKQVIHSDVIFDVCCGPSPDQFLSCGEDRTVLRYDWRKHSVLDLWRGHTQCVNRVVFDARLHCAFSASRDRTIRQWRPERPEAVQVFVGHELSIHGLATDAALTDTLPPPLPRAESHKTLSASASALASVCVPPAASPADNKSGGAGGRGGGGGGGGGGVLCSGARDCSVRFWDVETGRQTAQRSIERNMATGMRWVPREQSVLQTSEDLVLRVWDARTCLLAQTFEKQTYFPLGCDVSADGMYFLTCNNGFDGNGSEVVLWDRRRSNPVLICRGHTQAVRSVAFVAARDPALSLLSKAHAVLDDSPVADSPLSLSSLPSASASASASLLAVSASKDQTLRVWDLHSGFSLACAKLPHPGALSAVAAVPSASGHCAR